MKNLHTASIAETLLVLVSPPTILFGSFHKSKPKPEIFSFLYKNLHLGEFCHENHEAHATQLKEQQTQHENGGQVLLFPVVCLFNSFNHIVQSLVLIRQHFLPHLPVNVMSTPGLFLKFCFVQIVSSETGFTVSILWTLGYKS